MTGYAEGRKEMGHREYESPPTAMTGERKTTTLSHKMDIRIKCTEGKQDGLFQVHGRMRRKSTF